MTLSSESSEARGIVHLMQLKVVGHVNVAPVPCEISCSGLRLGTRLDTDSFSQLLPRRWTDNPAPGRSL